MILILGLFLLSILGLLSLAMIFESLSEKNIKDTLIFMILIIFGPIVVLQLCYEKLLKLFKGGKSAK